MDTSPIKIQRGMNRQLQTWRDTVASREQRLGWKVGFNLLADQQRLNLPSAMVGFLSHERRLVPGSQYRAPAEARLLIEPEIAILIGKDVPVNASEQQANAAISAYAAALELVDSTRSVDNDMEEILGGNLFHDSVLLGEQRIAAQCWSREHLNISLNVNDQLVGTLEQQRVPENFSRIIIDVANMLAAHGEQLQSGDWIITGAASTPVPVKLGDVISLDMGPLGHIGLSLA